MALLCMFMSQFDSAYDITNNCSANHFLFRLMFASWDLLDVLQTFMLTEACADNMWACLSPHLEYDNEILPFYAKHSSGMSVLY